MGLEKQKNIFEWPSPQTPLFYNLKLFPIFHELHINMNLARKIYIKHGHGIIQYEHLMAFNITDEKKDKVINKLHFDGNSYSSTSAWILFLLYKNKKCVERIYNYYPDVKELINNNNFCDFNKLSHEYCPPLSLIFTISLYVKLLPKIHCFNDFVLLLYIYKFGSCDLSWYLTILSEDSDGYKIWEKINDEEEKEKFGGLWYEIFYFDPVLIDTFIKIISSAKRFNSSMLNLLDASLVMFSNGSFKLCDFEFNPDSEKTYKTPILNSVKNIIPDCLKNKRNIYQAFDCFKIPFQHKQSILATIFNVLPFSQNEEEIKDMVQYHLNVAEFLIMERINSFIFYSNKYRWNTNMAKVSSISPDRRPKILAYVLNKDLLSKCPEKAQMLLQRIGWCIFDGKITKINTNLFCKYLSDKKMVDFKLADIICDLKQWFSEHCPTIGFFVELSPQKLGGYLTRWKTKNLLYNSYDQSWTYKATHGQIKLTTIKNIKTKNINRYNHETGEYPLYFDEFKNKIFKKLNKAPTNDIDSELNKLFEGE